MDSFINLLSIGLTPMTILACAVVIYLWYTPFLNALKQREKTAVGWLIIGVIINFIGSVFDNFYWLMAWSSDYINSDSDMKKFFFEHGTYSNTFFRQIAGILGAICHIHSGIVSHDKWLKRVVFGGAFLGIAWVVLLINLTVNK